MPKLGAQMWALNFQLFMDAETWRPDFSIKFLAFSVWSGPAGLGCTAPGTAYKDMPFRVWSGPAGLGCTVHGTAYKGIDKRSWFEWLRPRSPLTPYS